MVFNSFEFAVFLPIVFLAYWVLRHKQQNVLLVAASYVFYGWWNYRFLGLIVVSTLTDYVIGRAMGRTMRERQRKALLLASVVINLSILGFFKYFDFFADSAARIMEGVGLHADGITLNLILPVGISFYTFQTISYTFDVFRRRIKPEPNLVTFAAYVAFFPQLVAGPIERAAHLLPQVRSTRAFPTADRLFTATGLILTGLFKKVVLADGLSAIVDARFSSPESHGALSLLIGAYAFAIQIYGDFSGYSSIARGVSRLLGIELMRNFEQPYLSTSITQFWRTWHISLSSWLHDYLYVPLGGNRCGRSRTYRNLMLTMVIGGLWHGAGWTFVIWGFLHGIFLAVHRFAGAYEPRGRPASPRRDDEWRIIATFHLVAFAWIFFRADSVSMAWRYVVGFGRLGSLAAPGSLTLESSLVLVLGFGLIMLLGDFLDRNRDHLSLRLARFPTTVGAAAAVMIAAILIWSGGHPQPFIYFQF